MIFPTITQDEEALSMKVIILNKDTEEKLINLFLSKMSNGAFVKDNISPEEASDIMINILKEMSCEVSVC
jgi:hypothetical protein